MVKYLSVSVLVKHCGAKTIIPLNSGMELHTYVKPGGVTKVRVCELERIIASSCFLHIIFIFFYSFSCFYF